MPIERWSIAPSTGSQETSGRLLVDTDRKLIYVEDLITSTLVGVPHWVGPINFKFSDAPNDGDIFNLFDLKRGDFIYDDLSVVVLEWNNTGGVPGVAFGVDIGGPNEMKLSGSGTALLDVSTKPISTLVGNPGSFYQLNGGFGQTAFAVLSDTPFQIQYNANGGPDPATQGELNLWLLLARGVELP